MFSAEKTYAEEGESCEGFDERAGEPFPSCANGLVGKHTAENSIPGAGNTCVNGAWKDNKSSLKHRCNFVL